MTRKATEQENADHERDLVKHEPRNRFPYTPELKPFQDADDAWSAELQRLFGKAAGDARCSMKGSGEEGSELRRLHDVRAVAQALWHRSACK